MLAQPELPLPRYSLEILPPAKQEQASIIIEVQPTANKDYFAFNLIVENQSAQKYSLDYARDIRFAGPTSPPRQQGH